MAPHQTFYLKADLSLLNPHKSADWMRVASCRDVLINRAARILPCTHATVASCVACEIKPLTQSWSTRRMSSMRSLIIELSLLRVSVFMTSIVNCSFPSAS